MAPIRPTAGIQLGLPVLLPLNRPLWLPAGLPLGSLRHARCVHVIINCIGRAAAKELMAIVGKRLLQPSAEAS